MRILHVNKFLYRRGGAEAYMQDVAALQRRDGHEVAFFGMDHPENDPMPHRASFPPHLEFDPPPPGAAGKARAIGRMLWSPAARRGIEEVVAAFQPDVVHLHNIYHQLSPSVLRPLARRGIPAVMTLHDYKLVCPTYQMLDKGELCEACLTGGLRQAVKRRCRDGSLATSAMAAVEVGVHRRTDAYGPVARFLCPSAFLAGKMREGGAYPDRLHVLNNFVDTDGIAPADRPGSGIAAVCRLSHEKAVDTLIEAMAHLPEAVTLDIAGDGPQRAELERLAADRAPGRVRFHGRLPREAVLDLLRGAAVAAVPSRWYENQPISIIESFACGTPVVATALGGLPELITPGETGELTAPGDPRALAGALAPLAGDPDLAAAMGKAARAEAERRFSPAVHMDALHDHYRLAGEEAAAR